ncbi:MAG: hypothetical protein V8Q09_11425 [Adlercreutzia sp.]
MQEKILANLLQVLMARAQIYWGCPARQFLTADDGRVTGAVGQKEDGSYVQVNAAKGVIVCAGDYSPTLGEGVALPDHQHDRRGWPDRHLGL